LTIDNDDDDDNSDDGDSDDNSDGDSDDNDDDNNDDGCMITIEDQVVRYIITLLYHYGHAYLAS